MIIIMSVVIIVLLLLPLLQHHHHHHHHHHGCENSRLELIGLTATCSEFIYKQQLKA